MITEMKKMMSIFSINKRNSFDKINMHLKEGTKCIMEDAGRAFLKRKQALTTTAPPELVDAVASKVFTTTSPSTKPPRSIINTTTTTPWPSLRIIINNNNDDDYTDIEHRLMMLTGATNSGVRGGCTMLLAGAILG